MRWQKYIHCDPEILCGKPVIKGTRISVELILERLSDGCSVQDILESYPHISEVHVRAALAFASALSGPNPPSI